MQMESMEWTCQHCGGTGEVKHPTSKIEESMLIVCSHCSTPSVYAWCEKCGEGMERDKIDLADQPKTWVCQTCDTEYRFPSLFYQYPIYFKPSKYSAVIRIKNEINFSKYEHVNSIWLRAIILWWDKHYLNFIVFSGMALLLEAGVAALLEKISFSLPLLGFFMIITLIFFGGSAIIHIALFLVSGIYILYYEIRKKQD